MGKRSEYIFKKIQKVANAFMKRYSTPLVIREMQIRTPVRYNFQSTRMARIEKSDNKKG